MSAGGRCASALLIAAIMLTGCPKPALMADEPKVVRGQVLHPYDTHEDCFHLEPGDRLDYTFESSEPVDFNLHYHEGAAVVMPLAREKTLNDAGVFAPSLAQDYCLMWEAGAAGAVLDYRLRWRPRDSRTPSDAM